MVVAVGGGGKAALFGATTVIEEGGGGDAVEVAPSVVSIVFAPAVSGAGGDGGGCQCRGEAVKLAVGECQRTGGVKIVGYRKDVTGVVIAVEGIGIAVGDIHGAACARRSFELIRLEANVVSVRKVEPRKRRGLADGKGIEGALRGVADG